MASKVSIGRKLDAVTVVVERGQAKKMRKCGGVNDEPAEKPKFFNLECNIPPYSLYSITPTEFFENQCQFHARDSHIYGIDFC